ncbi:MAG: glycosyltransferase family 4 protein [Gammaproteobacteria bacterium]|nr:glycosyltransferase family 4 protein [Gammaproteobacteria bacterium]
MKICLVHNAYGKFSGEEAMVRDTRSVLIEHDHEVVSFERTSEEIAEMRLGSVRAFLSGIYNPASRKQFRKLLASEQPDIIHIHNLFPLISPSILPEAKVAGIPVVMTVHNYRLICPNGLHYQNGKVCEQCVSGHEYKCVINNCERNIAKSLGYAARNMWARINRYYLDNVSHYACLTKFQREKLIRAGFPQEKISVVPNMVQMAEASCEESSAEYVGFVGRLSPEKGISTLIDAAQRCPAIPFVAAGAHHRMPGLADMAPKNFSLLGHCEKGELVGFYKQARVIVLPSVWWETFGLVVVEAMLHGKPVICSKIGGLSEIVEDGVTGLLVEPGDPKDLAEKVQHLWDRPELCRQMGMAGREKALREYSPEKYYDRLMGVYKKAIESCSV